MQTYSDKDGGARQNRLRWIAIAVLVLILVVCAIFIASKDNNQSSGFPPAYQQQSTVFQGMSSFINNGLTTDQVNYLLGAFSKFSPHAKQISVDPKSISPAPHSPSQGNNFSLNFSLTIDSTPYKGVASYSNLTSIRVALFNLSGKKVFDSGVIPPLD